MTFSDVTTALRVETLKFRLAPVVWLTTLVMLLLVPLISAGGYALVRFAPTSPSALKAQAMLHGQGWDALYSLAAQGMAVTVFLGVGVVVSWCLGREFTEQTIVGLFAQPVPRKAIALAKVLVILTWATLLSVLLAGLVLLGGMWCGLPLSSGLSGATRLLVLGLLTAVSTLPVGWIASALRGYLPGIGAVLGLLMVSQFGTALGGGAWIPWAAPALWAGLTGPEGTSGVSLLQLLLPVLVGGISLLGLTSWWQHAELGNSRS